MHSACTQPSAASASSKLMVASACTMRLVMAMPMPGPAASFLAHAKAAAANSASGTTRLYSPMRWACAASMNSPSKSSSLACPMPTILGNNQAAPMSAPDKPTLVKRKAILALGAAMRTSAAAAITAPAPHAKPFTPHTIGFSRRSMFAIKSQVMRVKACTCAASASSKRAMMSFWSPPEQKARPVPVSSTERTELRVRNAAKVSVSSRYDSKVKALRRSGRSKRTTATPSSS